MIKSGNLAVNDNRKRLPLRAPTNKVSLFGRLCVDPVTRLTKKGRPIVHFSLMAAAPATGQSFRDLEIDRSMGAATCHHVVVADDQLAKLAVTKLTSGSMVHLEGQLQTRQASNLSDTPKIVTEIVIFGAYARLLPQSG